MSTATLDLFPQTVRVAPPGERARATDRAAPSPSIVCDACARRRLPWCCASNEGLGCRADQWAGHIAAIMPRVPLRHWRLALPWQGRWPGADGLAAVARAFAGALFEVVRQSAAVGVGVGARRCGAVTIVRRVGPTFGSELSLHALVLDGVYIGAGDGGGPPVFAPHAAAPDPRLVAAAVGVRLRRAHASGALRVIPAPVAGPWVDVVRRIVVRPGVAVGPPMVRGRARGVCVQMGDVLTPARRAAVIELARILVRPVADPRRVSRTPQGWLRFALPVTLSDGTSAVEVSPAALAERLGPQWGGPIRRVRFHGILAAGGGARDEILPIQLGLGDEPPRLLSPPPPGRLPAHRVAAVRRVAARHQTPAGRATGS